MFSFTSLIEWWKQRTEKERGKKRNNTSICQHNLISSIFTFFYTHIHPSVLHYKMNYIIKNKTTKSINRMKKRKKNHFHLVSVCIVWMNECDCQWFIDFNRNFIYFSFCLFFNEHYSIQKLFLDSYWFFLFLFFCCCCCFRSFWVFVCYNYYNSDCCWNENDNEKVKFVHKIVMFVWYFKPKSVCLFVFYPNELLLIMFHFIWILFFYFHVFFLVFVCSLKLNVVFFTIIEN